MSQDVYHLRVVPRFLYHITRLNGDEDLFFLPIEGKIFSRCSIKSHIFEDTMTKFPRSNLSYLPNKLTILCRD